MDGFEAESLICEYAAAAENIMMTVIIFILEKL